MPQPFLVLLGAPGTGAQALANALASHPLAPTARIVWGESLAQCLRFDGATQPPAAALHQLVGAGMVMLMGLDLPCPAGERADQEAADTRLRAELAGAGLRYSVVYGTLSRRITQGVDALKNIATSAFPTGANGLFDPKNALLPAPPRADRNVWGCEKCSDPGCEHRLFTALVERGGRRI